MHNGRPHNRNGFGNGRRNGNGGRNGNGRTTRSGQGMPKYSGHTHNTPGNMTMTPWTGSIPYHSHDQWLKESPPHNPNNPQHTHMSQELYQGDMTGSFAHQHTMTGSGEHFGSPHGEASDHTIQWSQVGVDQGFEKHKHHAFFTGSGHHTHQRRQRPPQPRSGGGRRTMGSKTTRRGRERGY